MDAWLFLLRWFHFLAGITWIGMLYYFNFVQVPFFAGAEPPVRTGMIAGGLVSRALWWFRWGAMLTFITGWLYLLHRIGQFGVQPFFATSYGWAIFIGGIIGSLMWFNVWFIIWPAQQVVMASTARVKEGGQAIPEAAARGARRRRLSHEHPAVDPDAVLHGLGEPLRLLHADVAGGEDRDARRLRDHPRDRRGQRGHGTGDARQGERGQEAPQHRQGHALGGIRAHGDLRDRDQDHLRLIRR